ncbi:MAG: N-terminal domain [Marmoricola sp.]|nr:N-terminal domain [Marmoricola sp.]
MAIAQGRPSRPRAPKHGARGLEPGCGGQGQSVRVSGRPGPRRPISWLMTAPADSGSVVIVLGARSPTPGWAVGPCLVGCLRRPSKKGELGRIDVGWRAANYLSVGQIYLMAKSAVAREACAGWCGLRRRETGAKCGTLSPTSVLRVATPRVCFGVRDLAAGHSDGGQRPILDLSRLVQLASALKTWERRCLSPSPVDLPNPTPSRVPCLIEVVR